MGHSVNNAWAALKLQSALTINNLNNNNNTTLQKHCFAESRLKLLQNLFAIFQTKHRKFPTVSAD